MPGWAGVLARGSSYSPRLPIPLRGTVAAADFITAHSCGAAVDSPRLFGDTPPSLPQPVFSCALVHTLGGVRLSSTIYNRDSASRNPSSQAQENTLAGVAVRRPVVRTLKEGKVKTQGATANHR